MVNANIYSSRLVESSLMILHFHHTTNKHTNYKLYRTTQKLRRNIVIPSALHPMNCEMNDDRLIAVT